MKSLSPRHLGVFATLFAGATALVSSRAPSTAGGEAVLQPGYTLIGWNDLGMHCMDSDYSVFSILPPFNTVEAQLIDPRGRLVTNASGISVTYEAVADPSGSRNTSSVGKTNFWDHAPALYGGSSVVDTGLAGNDMPGASNVPQPMGFDAASARFHADGIPITPYDDQGRARSYPLMRLVARDAAGVELASTEVVLPVSDEMDCSLCHGSGTELAAQPTLGWVEDRNFERDYRLNVLRLHDEIHAADPRYASALATAGYDAGGLEATVNAGTSILCARCHASNALPGTGIQGIVPLTAAIHGRHAWVVDPVSGTLMNSSTNRASCYRCHPGSETRCLRGAMGAAVEPTTGDLAMQCQDCHGSMSDVGDSNRQGWFDQPNCQACHTGTAVSNNGQIRYTSVFEPSGAMRVAVDDTFATDADTPLPGTSLYRFSTGHGGLRCESCHGSTHAVFPAAHGNDNLQSQDLQGHVGTLVECTACHDRSPDTVTGGPHGMHPVDARWVHDHGDFVENNSAAQCRDCHGLDYRGTVLSRAHDDRTFNIGDLGTRSFARGQTVGCYDCHRGPTSDDRRRDLPPTLQGGTMDNDGRSPSTITLQATDPEGAAVTLRVVRQPEHGTVTVAGLVATYRPFGGFAGTDTFLVVARDAFEDSAAAIVRVRRGADSVVFGSGFPGTGGQVPTLTVSAPPVLGTRIDLVLDNTAGSASTAALLLSPERARVPTPFGGMLLVLDAESVTLSLPAGGGSVPAQVPNDPALIGVVLHTQAVQIDAGARFGLAFTAGLRLVLGR